MYVPGGNGAHRRDRLLVSLVTLAQVPASTTLTMSAGAVCFKPMLPSM